MSPSDAAREVAEFLDQENVPYAVIGGLAVQCWGESRTTRDVDIVVMVETERMHSLIGAALNRFSPRVPDPVDFAVQNRVLLLATVDGTPIDISFGIPGYEESAIARARTVTMAGHSIRVLSPEDLIVHKCIAGRPRDFEDIESILIRMRGDIDLEYVRSWLAQFAEVIDGGDLIGTFEGAATRAGQRAGER